MKLNRIVLVSLIACISQAAMANEIYKGKITSEKLWADNGSKVKLVTTKMRGNHEQGFVYVDTYINGQKAAVNTPVSVAGSSQSNVYVENNSEHAQSYFLRQTVCAETEDHNAHCLHRYVELELEPTGYYNDGSLPDITTQYATAGTYKISVESHVVNHAHNHSTASNAEGYVVVS